MKKSYRPSLALQRMRYESMLNWRRILAKRGNVEGGRARIRDNSTPYVEKPASLADVYYIMRRIRAKMAAYKIPKK